MTDWADWIGKGETRHDVITPGLLQRFCATIDRPVTDEIPQGLHWCLCLPDAPTAQLAEDGHPEKGGFLPPIPLPRRMWASSSVSFEQPLQLGDTVSRVSSVATMPRPEKTRFPVPVSIGRFTLNVVSLFMYLYFAPR